MKEIIRNHKQKIMVKELIFYKILENENNNFNIKDLIDENKELKDLNFIPKPQNIKQISKQTLSLKEKNPNKKENTNQERENLKKNLLLKKNEVLENAFNDDEGK
jgi:hypothetical protein